MGTARLEAFSDGVLAITITIMVLEVRAPHSADFAALVPLVPVVLSYLLSFVYVGIYWNNHHHMLHVTDRVNGTVLWANLHLLFWLSLIPFVTAWMGENSFSSAPTARRYSARCWWVSHGHGPLSNASRAASTAREMSAACASGTVK